MTAELPSVPGSTGLKWSAEEQRWVPLFGQLQRSLGSSNQAKSMVSPTQIGPAQSTSGGAITTGTHLLKSSSATKGKSRNLQLVQSCSWQLELAANASVWHSWLQIGRLMLMPTYMLILQRSLDWFTVAEMASCDMAELALCESKRWQRMERSQ